MGEAGLDAEAVARLRLIRTPSIGPVTFRHLIGRFGTGEAALAAVPDLARRSGGRVPQLADPDLVRREAGRVAELGARYLFWGMAHYPPLLAELEDAPPALIVAGDSQLAARPVVAMVGARNASAAAVRFARHLAHDLAEEGWVVASGLARGIDTAAHQGSLDKGTIGVIAGGIDVVYPPENADLQRAIAERGLLIAEQPPGTEPRARHFPYRNRIIAGLAQGTIVVEAAPKSGSLITARLAGEAGREVLAVPGSPLDPRAQGCNQLIRDGATLIQNAADVIESLRPLDYRAIRARGAPLVREEAPDIGTDERDRIRDLLSPSPVAIDEIARQSGLPMPVVQTALLELELGGRLERHAGGRVSLAT